VVLAVVLATLSASAAPKASAHQVFPRRLERRTLAITDASFQDVPVVHVAKGVPTTLSFGQGIRRESILLADTSDAWDLGADGVYRAVARGEPPQSAQATLLSRLAVERR